MVSNTLWPEAASVNRELCGGGLKLSVVGPLPPTCKEAHKLHTAACKQSTLENYVPSLAGTGCTSLRCDGHRVLPPISKLLMIIVPRADAGRRAWMTAPQRGSARHTTSTAAGTAGHSSDSAVTTPSVPSLPMKSCFRSYLQAIRHQGHL